jgi:hypothetical protein
MVDGDAATFGLGKVNRHELWSLAFSHTSDLRDIQSLISDTD